MASGYTVGPLYSNDISSAYYDYAEQIGYIVNTDEQFELPGIHATADREQAYADAERLQKEYNKINDDIKALTKEINADESLTRAERAMTVRVPTEERLKLMDEFLGMYTEYMQEYGQQDLWSRWFELPAK